MSVAPRQVDKLFRKRKTEQCENPACHVAFSKLVHDRRSVERTDLAQGGKTGTFAERWRAVMVV